MTMKGLPPFFSKFYLSVLFFVLLILGAFYGMHVLKENAKAIAKNRIEIYCEKNAIPFSKMHGPIMSKQHFFKWVFDYTSSTTPKHTVLIYVNALGFIETHRYIDEP